MDAGFSKGSDGVWLSPTPRFGRMAFEINVLASPDSDNEMHLMSDSWRKLGFELKEVDWAPALGQDNEVRNTFPGLSSVSEPPGESALDYYRSDRIPASDRRWEGRNRGAWQAPPDFDRLVDTMDTSLDRGQRTQAIVQMIKAMTEDVVNINLYWKLNAQAVSNELTGPRLTDPDGTAEWNIQQWALK